MKLQQTIRRILREEKLYATPQQLVKNLPDELKKLLFKQWGAKQNPEWHPEGNTLKHILVVLKRAYHHYPNDPNMIMAALFHDLGKMDTYSINPKTNQPTAYGHEDRSTDYVEQFKDWVESFEGTDVDEIKYLVKNHMKVKPRTWNQMKDKKKEPIKSHPAFDKLMGFTDKLDGGGIDLKESIRRILREETEIPLFIKRRFTPEDLEWLINDIKELIEFGESLDTAIYDGVREFIKGKKFSDIDEFGDEQSYWDSYLKYEKPLVKYVKDKINNTQITEETDNKRMDKSSVIEKLLYKTFVTPNNDIVCGVEVKHPDDREVLQGQPKYISYRITITFIAGSDSKHNISFSMREKYDDLGNEAWHIVYDYTNTPCDIFFKFVKEC